MSRLNWKDYLKKYQTLKRRGRWKTKPFASWGENGNYSPFQLRKRKPSWKTKIYHHRGNLKLSQSMTHHRCKDWSWNTYTFFSLPFGIENVNFFIRLERISCRYLERSHWSDYHASMLYQVHWIKRFEEHMFGRPLESMQLQDRCLEKQAENTTYPPPQLSHTQITINPPIQSLSQWFLYYYTLYSFVLWYSLLQLFNSELRVLKKSQGNSDSGIKGRCRVRYIWLSRL